MYDSITGGLSSLSQGISGVVSGLSEGLGNLGSNIFGGLADVGNTIMGGLGSLGETLGNFFKDLLTGIIDGLKTLFIPTVNPFDELKEILYSKLPIIQEVELAVNGTLAMFEQTHEPKFALQFTGQYGLTGDVATLNLAPYEPYRQIVKNIIKALLWLTTLVYIQRTIPKMLGGVAYDS